jgi:hypothetical protein
MATIGCTSGILSTNFKWFRANHDARRQERKGTRESRKAGQDTSVARYLDLLRAEDTDAQALLGQNYYGPGRDSEIQNSIFLTQSLMQPDR